MRQFSYTALLLALALAGCTEHAKNAAPLYMLYSPNGEPLNGGPLGKPTCEKAMSGWFDRLSAAHNGVIPQDVFLRDAQIQFARMDIDHNGYIVSEELDRFREPYRQEAPARKQPSEPSGQKQGRQSGRSDHTGTGTSGNQADLSFTLADPVMSADSNLDFKVTPEEFMKQAQDTFTRLDARHEGALSRAEIVKLCEQFKK